MKVIVGGHYTSAPEGWMALSEQEQDITKPLIWKDNSLNTIYLEHVWEHLPFEGAINFSKESMRCLNKGGVIRIICPTIDKLIQFKSDDVGKLFSDFQLQHYFTEQDRLLKELGLEGIREEPISFLFDSLLKGHNHIHVWTSQLIKKVLEKIGFSEVYICEPGETHFNKEDCLERIVRGIHPQVALDMGITHYDPESLVIEAKK